MPVLECLSLKTMERIPIPERTILCLGNFDGVHLAHRELLSAALRWRDSAFPGVAAGVFCFRRLPADDLLPEPPGHLCTAEERLERFRECGMEFVILAEFSELRELSPEAYIREILIGACRCVGVACGFNHRFGKGGKGTPDDLRKWMNGGLLVQDRVLEDGEIVSSTRIRALLAQGRPEEAARLLAHPYSLRAPVLHGKRLGRRIGAPTINQNFPANAVLPRFGVYFTTCIVDGKRYPGVSNVGVHPTVDNASAINCETHLPDFSGDLYGRVVMVSFLRFLRPEMKFSGVEALRAQIAADVAAARELAKREDL